MVFRLPKVHLIADVGVMASNIRYIAVLARDWGYMELSQWLRILPVYYSDVVLPA
jgi:hypothetical protein